MGNEFYQAGGSGDGTDSKPGVPDEPKGKSVDTNKGTGLKPRVPDVSKAESFESEYESWGDSGDEANVQETNDDEEESDNEFVHTPEDYVPTDDEANDETKDVDEEEYEKISEELYGDVNVRLTYAEHNDEEKGDVDMTNVVHVQEHSVPADVIDVLKQQQKPHESAEEILKIKMEQAEKQPESKYTIRSSDKIELAEFDLKQALFDSMHASKSFNKTPKNKTLYHALMESLIKDENVMDQGLADLIKQKKRPHDDADKDEGPTTGSDRGDQGENLGKTDEQPNDEAVPKND
ncbi:hypothetical protein Tco_0222056 [Tanacetum coccineum]